MTDQYLLHFLLYTSIISFNSDEISVNKQTKVGKAMSLTPKKLFAFVYFKNQLQW